MNKVILGSAIAVVLGTSASANAALSDGVTIGLSIDAGVVSCLSGGTPPDSCTHGLTAVNEGSYFAMDTNGDGQFFQPERVAISGTGGLLLDGTPQANGEIDSPWAFANNFGRHNTTGQGTTPSINADGTVDMSGWTVYWGAAGAEVNINMGTGAAATVTCTSGTFTCANGETYTLDYTTVVPPGQPFENVPYQLHLEGTVSAIPVPAAVWLFGSGLVGLAGIARRRKAA